VTKTGAQITQELVLVNAYLAAIIAANLIVTHKGPTWSVYTAFVLIGLDLTTRDRLHDLWRGHVLRNMAFLTTGTRPESHSPAASPSPPRRRSTASSITGVDESVGPIALTSPTSRERQSTRSSFR